MVKILILYVLFPFLYTMLTLFIIDYSRDRIEGDKYIKELIIMTLGLIISVILVSFLLLITVTNFEDYLMESDGWAFAPMMIFSGLIYNRFNKLLSK